MELPKPDEFTERDFSESDQESRDPFRNFIQVQEEKEKKGGVIVDTSVVFLKEYSLSELRLTGIVGRSRRFAMVLDPRSGRTTILKTRDVIGKERALIFQIARDHLVLLVPRVRPGKAEPYERKKLYVDETRKIVDIGRDRLRPDESGIRYTHRRGRRAASRAKEP